MPTSKIEAAELIEAARAAKPVTYAALAAKIDRPPVWTVAALHGQHPMEAADAQAICDELGLGEDVAAALQRFPNRGEGLPPPSRPIRRSTASTRRCRSTARRSRRSSTRSSATGS